MTPGIARQLDVLEEFHGRRAPQWPVDPYEFLVWWQCGYPPSDAACAKGYASLSESLGLSPESLLACTPAALAKVLQPGGMIPLLRAQRVQQVANAVRDLGGDLMGTLRARPLAAMRKILKDFPGIGTPGADRILLFAKLVPVAAVPSNAPQVAVRMQRGIPQGSYAKDYRAAQEIIESQLPGSIAKRRRAFLLLKVHGEKLCKRTKPACPQCPIVKICAFGSKARS